MKVYFYHIPKVGGTSINYSFFSLSGEDPKKIYDNLNKSPERITRAGGYNFVRDSKSIIQSGKFNYGFSHMPCYEFNLPKGFFTFTCFRDPIARVISVYKSLMWTKKENKERIGHAWLGRSFSDFLKKVPKNFFRYQLYIFSPEYKRSNK